MQIEIPPGLWLASAAWPQVAERLAAGAPALLPVGAACKQHGPHLPMHSDWLQAEWLARALAERASVVCWPTLGYGYYPAFTDYPGSISLSVETFTALVGEILAGIRAAGATRCLVLNTGISTIAPLRQAIQGASGFGALELANVYAGPAYRREEGVLREQLRGSHADELETSILLAIAPEQVAMGRAQDCSSRELHGAFSRSDRSSPGYSSSGVYGDPRLASAAKGRRLLEAMLQDLLTALQRLDG
jgi:creatinine amidohydrolase